MSQTLAQANPNERTAGRANPKFELMVSEAEKHKSQRFRFGQLRRTYMQTLQYDPLGEETMDRLLRLSFTAENTQDPEEARRAFGEFRLLVKDHLAHLRVVIYALSLSRQDKRYGDPAFYSWVRDGLIQNVMASGDGTDLQNAYDVITPIEETAIFTRLGVKKISTESRIAGFYRYNIHRVEDAKTGRQFNLHVNTTFPVKFLEQLNPTRRDVDINRQ